MMQSSNRAGAKRAAEAMLKMVALICRFSAG